MTHRSAGPIPYVLLFLGALLLAGVGVATLRASLPPPRGTTNATTDLAGVPLLVALACLVASYPAIIVATVRPRGWRLFWLGLASPPTAGRWR